MKWCREQSNNEDNPFQGLAAERSEGMKISGGSKLDH